jgi:putative endonuclease
VVGVTSSGRGQVKDEVGRTGELLAREFLERAGMTVLDANWRCPLGEIDLVVRDGDDLVVVEVKTRTSTAFGHPAEAVTAEKLGRLRRLAGAWVAAHEVRAAGLRIDVVAVLRRRGRPVLVEHLRAVS